MITASSSPEQSDHRMKETLYQPPDEGRAHALAGRPLASFTRRAVALVLDVGVAALTFMILIVGVGVLLTRSGILALESDVVLKFTFFGNWYSVIWLVLYFTLSIHISNGRTIGKSLCGIRVVSLVHPRLTLWHSLERALGYGASALEAGFGFFQYFIRPDRRTVHDRIAETVVLRETRTPPGS
jgi:uncharacterized RDD family membrane protein YckC